MFGHKRLKQPPQVSSWPALFVVGGGGMTAEWKPNLAFIMDLGKSVRNGCGIVLFIVNCNV